MDETSNNNVSKNLSGEDIAAFSVPSNRGDVASNETKNSYETEDLQSPNLRNSGQLYSPLTPEQRSSTSQKGQDANLEKFLSKTPSRDLHYDQNKTSEKNHFLRNSFSSSKVTTPSPAAAESYKKAFYCNMREYMQNCLKSFHSSLKASGNDLPSSSSLTMKANANDDFPQSFEQKTKERVFNGIPLQKFHPTNYNICLEEPEKSSPRQIPFSTNEQKIVKLGDLEKVTHGFQEFPLSMATNTLQNQHSFSTYKVDPPRSKGRSAISSRDTIELKTPNCFGDATSHEVLPLVVNKSRQSSDIQKSESSKSSDVVSNESEPTPDFCHSYFDSCQVTERLINNEMEQTSNLLSTSEMNSVSNSHDSSLSFNEPFSANVVFNTPSTITHDHCQSTAKVLEIDSGQLHRTTAIASSKINSSTHSPSVSGPSVGDSDRSAKNLVDSDNNVKSNKSNSFNSFNEKDLLMFMMLNHHNLLSFSNRYTAAALAATDQADTPGSLSDLPKPWTFTSAMMLLQQPKSPDHLQTFDERYLDGRTEDSDKIVDEIRSEGLIQNPESIVDASSAKSKITDFTTTNDKTAFKIQQSDGVNLTKSPFLPENYQAQTLRKSEFSEGDINCIVLKSISPLFT